ncbi:hypothetical protein B0H14DRAFT_3459374 [Mycena olivaceomarginata]|nr:hypothetical protein B0H14DRAFT_3459374 [Mycena olivaceomarginata]
MAFTFIPHFIDNTMHTLPFVVPEVRFVHAGMAIVHDQVAGPVTNKSSVVVTFPDSPSPPSDFAATSTHSGDVEKNAVIKFNPAELELPEKAQCRFVPASATSSASDSIPGLPQVGQVDSTDNKVISCGICWETLYKPVVLMWRYPVPSWTVRDYFRLDLGTQTIDIPTCSGADVIHLGTLIWRAIDNRGSAIPP